MNESENVSPEVQALARVQERLTSEREKRVEERFVWILVVVILIDIDLLENIKNVAVPLVVLVLELILLTIVAKRMGVSSAAVVIDRVTSAIAKKETE